MKPESKAVRVRVTYLCGFMVEKGANDGLRDFSHIKGSYDILWRVRCPPCALSSVLSKQETGKAQGGACSGGRYALLTFIL